MSMIPNKLDNSKVWKIASVGLYDDNAVELIHRDYLDTSVNISTELISNFVKTLENFAQNQFHENVYEIHFGEYRILFDEYGSFILTAIVLPGDDVDTGKNSPMSKIVRKMFEKIGVSLNLKSYDPLDYSHFDTKFLDDIVNTINSTADNPDSVFHNIQNLESSDEFFVTSIIITDNLGRPYVTRTYEEGIYNEDPLLISSLISAISQFASLITELEFKEIVFGKYRLYLKNESDRIYVTTIEFPTDEVVYNHNSEVHQYVQKLNESLTESTAFLNDQKRVSDKITINHHTLTAVVDALVIKSIQKTIGVKEINRSGLKNVDLFNQKGQNLSGQRITDDGEYDRAKSFFARFRGIFKRSKE